MKTIKPSLDLDMFHSDFERAFSTMGRDPRFNSLDLSFETSQKPLQGQEILAIEVSFKVKQVTDSDRLIFDLFAREIVQAFYDITRPSKEILPDDAEGLRARFVFLAGHPKEMIIRSRAFLAEVLSSSTDFSNYLASLKNTPKFPNAEDFFTEIEYFFHPIIKSHLQADPEIMFLFSQHFRISSPRNPFKSLAQMQEFLEINLHKQVENFISGLFNPIITFYFGCLLDLSLRQKGFQINWKKIFTLITKTLEIKHLGIFPHQNKLDFVDNFLTSDFLSQIQKNPPKKTPLVCPFLDRPNFLALQKLIYQYLQARREMSKIPEPRKDPQSLLLAGKFLDCESIDFHPLEKNPFLNPICPLDSNTPHIPLPPFARVE